MTKKQDTQGRTKNNIRADVIILGCSLPGIVTAHNLKKKFGDTMDIVVLDLAGSTRPTSKCNVVFQADDKEKERETDDLFENQDTLGPNENICRRYLIRYATQFNIPLPDAIMDPEKTKRNLHKVFEHQNGGTARSTEDYHNFAFLNIMERFELNQYQTLLDDYMKDLFQTNKGITNAEKKTLHYYDKTNMEEHLCQALLFSTSREVMRLTIRIVCGADSGSVSVLFYLHQCYRNSSTRNLLDGTNTKTREKLFGHYRKRLASKLQQSIADITLSAKPIELIRTYCDEQVILETRIGDSNYVCNLLAMAIRPDELHKIKFESKLLSHQDATVTRNLKPGLAKKFVVQYEENFWNQHGFSGDILSIRGPIIWATERPRLSSTGSLERYSALIGYLKVTERDQDSKEAVLQQLVKLFGEEAATPINYSETDIDDVFIPRCGDYVALRKLGVNSPSRFMEWSALDIFAEGDVAAALEAGHIAYLHLVRCLRPQAQTFEDVSAAEIPTILENMPLTRLFAKINFIQSIQLAALTTVLYLGMRLVRSYLRQSQ